MQPLELEERPDEEIDEHDGEEHRALIADDDGVSSILRRPSKALGQSVPSASRTTLTSTKWTWIRAAVVLLAVIVAASHNFFSRRESEATDGVCRDDTEITNNCATFAAQGRCDAPIIGIQDEIHKLTKHLCRKSCGLCVEEEAASASRIVGHSIQMDATDLHWTDSHSPYLRNDENSMQQQDVRISFRLHDPADVPYPKKFLSVPGYMCFAGELPPSLSGRTLLNFTTTISTNLNIIFIGDSISQQFAQGFYAAVLDENKVGSHVIVRSFYNGVPEEINGQWWTNSGLHVCSSIVAPTRGGGVSAYWRTLELMSEKNGRSYYVNCKNKKYWSSNDWHQLTNFTYYYPPPPGKNKLNKKKTNKSNGATTWMESQISYINESQVHQQPQSSYNVGGFDACVLKPQHGWMEIGEITRGRLVEQIELCHQTVGARTVIMSTLPLNNNVLNVTDWEGIIKINDIIRDIARGWKLPPLGEGGVRWVLVQEFGNFTNQLLWRNAQVSLV